MNKIRVTTRKALRWVVRLSVIPFLVLGGCESNPLDPVDDGVRYLDEIFEATTANDIQYGAAMDETGTEEALFLDLHQPANDVLARRPAVIWIHGGSFQQGHKAEMTDLSHASARRGVVSVSLNYRIREGQTFDYTDPEDPVGEAAKRDAQHDVQAAVRWLRASADDLRIDPDHIFLGGFSAGGTAALRAAAASPDDAGSSGNPGWSSRVAAVVAISASVEAGMLEGASGSTLLIHGTDDTKIPLAGVQTACAAVSGCSLVTINGAVHNMINSAKAQIISEVARFLHAEITR